MAKGPEYCKKEQTNPTKNKTQCRKFTRKTKTFRIRKVL